MQQRSPARRGWPTPRRRSRRRSSRHRCGRCSWSPGQVAGRPRRWPHESSGSWPTGWSPPIRCLGSRSPARRPPSSPSGSTNGCAACRLRGSGRPRPTRRVPRSSAGRRPSRPTTRMPVGWSASTPCGWATSPTRDCCPKPPPGSMPPRWSPATTGTCPRWARRNRPPSGRSSTSRVSWQSISSTPARCVRSSTGSFARSTRPRWPARRRRCPLTSRRCGARCGPAGPCCRSSTPSAP